MRTKITVTEEHIASAKSTKTGNPVALAAKAATGRAASFDGVSTLTIGRRDTAQVVALPARAAKQIANNGYQPMEFSVTVA